MPILREEEKKRREEEARRKKSAEELERERGGAEFIGRREKLISRGVSREEAARQAAAVPTAGQRTVEEVRGRAAVAEEEFFQPVGELRTELEQKIAEPPSLAPEPIIEKPEEVIARQKRQREFIGKLISGKVSKEELTKEAKNFATGLAITGAVAAAVFAAPHIAALVAKIGITKAVVGTGGSVPLLKTAIAGTSLFLVGKGVFDFRGDEMDVLRQGLKKVVEDGERIEAAVRNGFSITDATDLLRTMADEVNAAEQRIKELGNLNLEYRVSKEYILDQQNARSSREAILRRVIAVENIALTGQAALNPEALMLDVSQFGGGEE